jgi:hypothetical protein
VVWAGAEMVKPNSSTTVTTAINSIERFIDLDLLHSLDVCSSPTDRLADPKEAQRTAQASSSLNELLLAWNTPSIALDRIHRTIMREICQEEFLNYLAAPPLL